MMDANLPGKPVSLWIATTPKTHYPSFSGNINADVCVIGAGITGITTAYLLKEAGFKVVVIDADRIATRVSGHTAAKVTSNHGLIYDYLVSHFGKEKAKMYAEANQTAIKKIREIVKDKGIDCNLITASSYTYVNSDQEIEKVNKEVEAAKSLGLPVVRVEGVEGFPDMKAGIGYENQAHFHPRKYLLHLASLIDGDGSYIFENTKALDIDKTSHEVTIAKGKIKAGNVVVTTHFPIVDPCGLFAKMWPRRSYVIAGVLEKPISGDMFYEEVDSNYFSIRNQPYDTNNIYLFGGEMHKTGHGGETTRHYLELADKVRSRYNVRSIEYRWSTQDYQSDDLVPFIGRVKYGNKNTYLATGFGGWGMTNSTVSAILLTDTIKGVDNPWSSLFDPCRTLSTIRTKSFISQNIDVAKTFIKGRTEEAGDIKSLRENEGKVVEVDGKKKAAYKDTQGNLHLVSAKCTHLGCTVTWNDAEKTWDCPCHGSRFNIEGEPVQTPAVKPLEKGEPRQNRTVI